jgi:hypothetical protein
VSGGAGDVNAIVGNPSNYLSVNAQSANKTAAMTYLRSRAARPGADLRSAPRASE